MEVLGDEKRILNPLQHYPLVCYPLIVARPVSSRWMIALLVLIGTVVYPEVSLGQEWGAVSGKVGALDTRYALPGASVVVYGTNFGTSSDVDGRFQLRLPIGNYVLRYSSIGFQSALDSVVVTAGQTIFREVFLEPQLIEIGEITVEGRANAEVGAYELTPEDLEAIPAPMKDALRALRVLPGVVVNNELSNQYSVRGGGFNENLFFINGFEIFLPFRPRTGEQEGLSLINGDLASRLTFYTGGFPVRFGGKLSSALDAEYRKPQRNSQPLTASAYASLLDYGLSASSSELNGRLGWLVGARKSQARRFFEKQDLKGEYQPNFTDLQGYVGYTMATGHELEVLGMVAENEFRLDPSGRKTYFGTLSQNEALAPSNLKSLWTRFDADNQELDSYQTQFLGARLSNRWSRNLRSEHDGSLFKTVESEFLDLSGTAILFQVDLGSDNPENGDGLFPTGSSRQEDAADNRIEVNTSTASGRWYVASKRHAAEAGWSLRHLDFVDRISEKSVVVGRATQGDIVRIVADSVNGSATLGAWQSSLYVQDTFDLLPNDPGKWVLTGGVRADHFSFTDEWTLSPRASFTYQKSPITTYFGSLGIYHQVPTYRELRGKPVLGETILGALNRNLSSQRSLQLVIGGEYFIPSKRFYIRGESYVKRITDLISYDIENVRVLYSGENDAKGLMYGLDLQMRGELVPGMESWINYSYLHATEEFDAAFVTPQNKGRVSRPTDQRHTVSLFVQDYIASDPSWSVHLRALYGSGLPYTPPIPGQRLGNILAQAPGDRFSARYTRFFRFDMGVTKKITPAQTNSRVAIELTAEFLNVFDMVNTVSYTWVPDASGIWQRIPTRLTPRTFNVRATMRF